MEGGREGGKKEGGSRRGQEEEEAGARRADLLLPSVASWFNSLLLPFLKDKTIPQGAATTVYACVAPDLEGMRAGAYLSDCKVELPSALARSQSNWVSKRSRERVGGEAGG